MTGNITIIRRNIADGEKFTHDGSVELHGDIGKGAVVDVKKGGILVKGSVADDASITAKGGGNDGLSGITVEKTTGSGVTLETDGAIELQGDAGDRLRAKADGSLSLQDAGSGLKANSGGGFHGDSIGPYANISAGGSLHIEELGQQSVANAGGSGHFEKIGTDCTVNTGGSARVESIGRDSTLNAGGSIRVSLAHTQASIFAGGSRKVGETSGNDGDFELTKTFRAAATPSPAAANPPAPDAPPPGGPKKGFSL